MSDEWLSTGDAASILGVSRQHVVDLCDRGDLDFVRVGTHRRVRRAELDAITKPHLTREQAKSLWLHRALLGPLMLDPHGTLEQARTNISAWLPRHRPRTMASRYLAEWERIVDEGVESTVEALTSTRPKACELRQNSPFAGILTESARRQALKAFRENWEAHEAA